MTHIALNRSLLCISLLLAQSLSFGQAADTGATSEDGYASMQVILYPPQLQMRGPLPFELHDTGMTFASLGHLAGAIGAIAGTALDSTLALARTRPSILRMLESTSVLGSDFDYDATIRLGIAHMVDGTDLTISAIEPYKFDRASATTSRWVFDNSNADLVMFFDPSYFMVYELDRLRFVADVAVYAHNGSAVRSTRAINGTYEYLSESRGSLFRNWDEGEREALTSMIEEHYHYKVGQFPHNDKAYRKDRDRALKALRGRDVILPVMAVNEGWSDEAFATEIRNATDYVIEMLRSDLMSFGGEPGNESDSAEVTFKTLTTSGSMRTRRGAIAGSKGTHTFYRDTDGNMYALPADFAATE